MYMYHDDHHNKEGSLLKVKAKALQYSRSIVLPHEEVIIGAISTRGSQWEEISE